jgi:hypothetical protein
MSQSVILNIEEKQEVGKAIDKMASAAADIVHHKDSGEIILYFHEGKFKRAKKTTTVQ